MLKQSISKHSETDFSPYAAHCWKKFTLDWMPHKSHFENQASYNKWIQLTVFHSLNVSTCTFILIVFAYQALLKYMIRWCINELHFVLIIHMKNGSTTYYLLLYFQKGNTSKTSTHQYQTQVYAHKWVSVSLVYCCIQAIVTLSAYRFPVMCACGIDQKYYYGYKERFL